MKKSDFLISDNNLLSKEDYLRKIAEIVHDITGIELGAKQQSMIESRVYRRILELKLPDINSYIGYIKDNFEIESNNLVTLLTTHHTYFFREFEHFQFFSDVGLQKIADAMKKENRTKLKVWSLACSRGQEVYSLAMFLDKHWPRIYPGATFQVLGSDVDSDSIAYAKNGVYHFDELKSVPAFYTANHWSRGRGEIADFVRVKDPIRKNCEFKVINLLDLKHEGRDRFDIIFCRNVFIYFIKEQIHSIVEKILPYINPWGYFVVGNTETLSGLNLPINLVKTSIYEKNIDGKEKTKNIIKEDTKKVIRVFCVDDSPTVLGLLKAILTPSAGFEVVGTALNGIDASRQVKEVAFDVMTLDIHMPEMNGIEYLSKYKSKNHPPIIMVSSVSREDSSMGLKAFELGALDYVEKPTMKDLKERSEELITKLRCAVIASDSEITETAQKAHEFTKDFSRLIAIEQSKSLRIIAGSPLDKNKLKNLIHGISGNQPPTILALECQNSLLDGLGEELQTASRKPLLVIHAESFKGSQYSEISDKIWICSINDLEYIHSEFSKERKCVYLIFNSVTTHALQVIKNLAKGKTLLEEVTNNPHPDAFSRNHMVNQVLPVTSFLYDSDFILSKVSDD